MQAEIKSLFHYLILWRYPGPRTPGIAQPITECIGDGKTNEILLFI